MSTASPVTHPRLRETVDGVEKLCTKCDEWWPADREFFFGDPEGVHRLFYCCKACYREQLNPRRLDKSADPQRRAFPTLFGARA
ncbi:hypothetical protein VG_p32 [Variovorax phage VarioGold]|uniref:hypothetical protein n=1 Tax=Variovorax sp. ZS18.2.2 TaxID=2971255 RepID=UPI002150E00F|nr:hypothetical protein [Variovorax sp. ZS18.2.2]MCR6477556.1 hypothetical protein [Variovorax sp. ZS18.2.2]UYD72080.1 hypothetical protein VG_p32 [Variovorax phage VarioGold]